METHRQILLDAILETAVDAIIVIDDHGMVKEVNPATERLFGFSDDELVGKNVRILMPDPYHAEHDGYLESYRETGVKKIIGLGREVIGKRKDGTTFPMHLAVSEIHVDGKRLFAGIVRDITDLKRVERQLQELNEGLEQRVQERTEQLRKAQEELIHKEKLATLGQVSGGIAHEIRNPLNAVKTSAYYLLNAKTPTSEKIREHLERIDRQVTMIDNVITALSDVARLPAPVAENCRVEQMIREAVSTVAMDETLRVDVQIPGDLPSIYVDKNQIPIVLRNLIRNARDAMPQGGVITISAESAEDRIAICVSDTGIGIDPEHLARITEPLYSTKARGMGLGLAISIAIIKKNNGSMSVTSEIDRGTSVTVTFPVKQIANQD